MPNAFFEAKILWDTGNGPPALALFTRHLDQEVGEAALKPASRITPEAFPRFELAVYGMLEGGDMVLAPWGRVFGSIWRMDPNDLWIAMLLRHEFADPLAADDFADLDLPPLDFGFDAIVESLTHSARRGLLAPDWEGPNNGRPVLRIEDIAALDEQRWGELKAMLLTQLQVAYAECPPDFWHRLVIDEPDQVVARFLHGLLLELWPPMEDADARWHFIVRDHPEWSTAVLEALDRLLAANLKPEYLTELVRVDAGFTAVEGRDWLSAFADRLEHGQLRSLPGVRVRNPMTARG